VQRHARVFKLAFQILHRLPQLGYLVRQRRCLPPAAICGLPVHTTPRHAPSKTMRRG
jgi:hypothetical protein